MTAINPFLSCCQSIPTRCFVRQHKSGEKDLAWQWVLPSSLTTPRDWEWYPETQDWYGKENEVASRNLLEAPSFFKERRELKVMGPVQCSGWLALARFGFTEKTCQSNESRATQISCGHFVSSHRTKEGWLEQSSPSALPRRCLCHKAFTGRKDSVHLHSTERHLRAGQLFYYGNPFA